MKRYLINHNCVYNEARNEIKNTDNALTIKMTAMRARCLSFIIEHAADGIIDKQKLTSALWGERGQFVSDANLTQLLYLIRKDLRTMGISDFFVTIPHMGIRVNQQIAVDVLPDEKLRKRYGIWKVVIITAFALSLMSLYAVFDMLRSTPHN